MYTYVAAWAQQYISFILGQGTAVALVKTE